ncbi:heme peroxidase [Thozetella sp. PMI_491]|nr:heme peroxidase [Thozetella sp. PMI_491]
MDNSSAILYVIIAAGASAAAYSLFTSHLRSRLANFKPTKEDYQKVYNEISSRLEIDRGYDDGSYGPILVRLAWHASGTYDAKTGTGGSNGATMRFQPECNHDANAGLDIARKLLEPVKVMFPWITYADLWILGGITAIQEMQGPIIPWRPGRSDKAASFCPPDGRLPDASQGSNQLRNIFNRMGFNDQEIVALAGAHSLGRCHTDRLGFDGPWTYNPTALSNEYYYMLLADTWVPREWDGPRQFRGASSQTLMMLPSDLALIADKTMRPWVEKYANNEELFFDDFRNVITKLFELGVPFKESVERWSFERVRPRIKLV